jgi:hypothetical protein
MTHRLSGLRCSLLALAGVLAIAGGLAAADPQINMISPYGVQRGTEAELTITGDGLADVKEILFYEPGFVLKKIEAAGNDKLTATIAVAPDCQLGLHAIRLRSLTGVSNLRMFTVGLFPEIKEVEPNNDPAKPQVVGLNVTVGGIVQAEDTDYFAVELQRGQRLTAELEGLRLGTTFFDPYLAILGPGGQLLATSDDAPLLAQDCLCSLVAPEDGRYLVQIRDISFGGSGQAVYRLNIGDFPRPTAVFPPGGKPGETLTVHWIGDAAGEFEQEITLPADGPSEAAIVASSAHGTAVSPNMVRVIDLPWANEIEPNNEVKTASSAPAAPVAMNGIIQQPGDVDFFRFAARRGQQLDVRVYARKPLRSPLDSVLSVHNAQGGTIANNDDTGGPDSYARVNIPADGEYLVSIRDQLGEGGPEYVYRVEITESRPALVMRLPERRQYVSTTLVVPSGNRNAVMVAAQRQNFNGELEVRFDNLPPGMTYEAIPMPAGMSEIPAIFTAAAGAEPAGALVGITGKTTDPKLGIVGRLDQRTMLVRGQNNRDVWGHNADRMATVLAEEIPYTLDIAPLTAPLVRSGSLDLKVVAKRAPGFTGAISLRMLYNPPGVASSGFVSIPENQNEAIVPLTASGNAALGTWKIVMTGRSGSRFDRGGGGNRGPDESLRCSTPFVDLTVADQYYKFAFSKAAVEQGGQTEVRVKIDKLKDFEGTAKVELLGLPANTTAQPLEFTKDTTELVFPVSATKDAKPGRYRSLVCVTKFDVAGQTVTHTLGGGELRVDEPLVARR